MNNYFKKIINWGKKSKNIRINLLKLNKQKFVYIYIYQGWQRNLVLTGPVVNTGFNWSILVDWSKSQILG